MSEFLDWEPNEDEIAATNIAAVMEALNFDTVDDLHLWSVEHREDFWELVLARLGIIFDDPPDSILGLESTVENPRWLPGARMNVVTSCFRHDPTRTALVVGRAGDIKEVSYGELAAQVADFASGLLAAGFKPGQAIGIAMPMHHQAVVAFLGIVAAGCVVVAVPDALSAPEMARRLEISGAVAVVTQDVVVRGARTHNLYEKALETGVERVIVLATGQPQLRSADLLWDELVDESGMLKPTECDPNAATTILFSSGTTGEPKAIPWTHLTPVKSAMDAHFHQDVRPDDVIAWPTNLGWMMGPWLVYSTLLHGATMALCDDQPTTEGFGRFIEESGVTLLGVVPTLVSSWRQSGCMSKVDMSKVRRFSSTGEASNAEDMRWLMALAGGKPVIEYCGGTELGGGYIGGTMVQPAIAATSTTPSFGLGVTIRDDGGHESLSGEIFLIPPSIGMSTELLNYDHHNAYFEGTPPGEVPLRRHGDQVERLTNGYFRVHGRVDDAMNLGGIKVGSAEVERSIAGLPEVAELAAVATSPPEGGPSRLVVYAVPRSGVEPNTEQILGQMNDRLRTRLSPLFRIHEVVFIDALPRTASNKVMRRRLRAEYESR